jgi:hypothetical protein
MIESISSALELHHRVETVGEARLESRFAVSDLAAASVGAVGAAASTLLAAFGLADRPPAVRVDRRLASLWFASSIQPIGWRLPPAWDPIAGDYEAADGWIKLHTNAPRHRQAALSVLGAAADRAQVEAAVRAWPAEALETAVVEAGGAAAAMRSAAAWAAHPQGKAVTAEPLIAWSQARPGRIRSWPASRERPLAGLRLLDLTRVLAGPVATRALAGFGANVLRIDPPDWEEPAVVPDVTLGKRCARLRLDSPEGRAPFERLLGEANLLIHGYRPGALDRLGYDEAERRRIAPDLIEVSLDAYGWTGPWSGRRGFDSLVQMSCGIAAAGKHGEDGGKPAPLPVQALDHATGWLIAAAALRALERAVGGEGMANARLSLARTAALLMAHPQGEEGGTLDPRPGPVDFSLGIERTPWGNARRLKPPLAVEGTPMAWDRPACALGSFPPRWE